MIYRQGDVMLIKVRKPMRAIEKKKDKVLREGEATGHKHEVIEGDVWVDENGNLFVQAPKEGAVVEHVTSTGTQADHKPVEIPSGWYEVVIEKDYDPYEETSRRVLD